MSYDAVSKYKSYVKSRIPDQVYTVLLDELRRQELPGSNAGALPDTDSRLSFALYYYLRVPRLSELAGDLGITHQAVSQRLRYLSAVLWAAMAVQGWLPERIPRDRREVQRRLMLAVHELRGGGGSISVSKSME